MLIKLGDQSLDAIVPELNRATVQSSEEPRPSGVESYALHSCALRFKERDERRALRRRHLASPLYLDLTNDEVSGQTAQVALENGSHNFSNLQRKHRPKRQFRKFQHNSFSRRMIYGKLLA